MNTTEPPATAPSSPLSCSIRIFCDVTCPWSFIGTRRFQRILKGILERKEQDVRVEVSYLPYFINPQYRRHPPAVSDARSPINRDNIIRAKIARLKTLGREEGIAFRFSEDSNSTDAAQTDPKNRPNTVPAHRLLRLAFQIGGAEMQWQVLNKLYSAYFEHGMDVSDVGVLAVLATDVLGKDRDCLVSFLNSELLKSEVLEEEEQGRTAGVTGVPSFLFDFVYNERPIFDFSLLGTQEIRTMEKIVERGFQVFSRRLEAMLNEEMSSSLNDQFQGISFSKL